MRDVVLRDASADDAAAIVNLLNAHAHALFGEAELTEAEVREWFKWPHLWFRIAERDGALVGYVDVANEQGTRFNVDLRTLDAETADVLVTAAEDHARQLAAEGAVIRGYAPAVDETVGAAYGRAGYRVIRHSFQMEIALERTPAAPAWPDGIRVRAFEEGEEERVYEAHMEAFEDHWGFRRVSVDEWRRYGRDRETFDPSLWFLAEDGDDLAGVALCAWHHSGDPHFGWVNVLGVRPAWRRRRLGSALLQHAFAEFARRGATRVGLGVDAENTTGAVRLYERAGMHVARRSDTYEKLL